MCSRHSISTYGTLMFPLCKRQQEILHCSSGGLPNMYSSQLHIKGKSYASIRMSVQGFRGDNLKPSCNQALPHIWKEDKEEREREKKINQNQNHRDIVKMNEIFYHSKTSRKSLHFKKTPRQNHVPTVYKSASQRSISVHSAKLHNTSDFTGNVHLFLKEVKTPASIR